MDVPHLGCSGRPDGDPSEYYNLIGGRNKDRRMGRRIQMEEQHGEIYQDAPIGHQSFYESP